MKKKMLLCAAIALLTLTGCYNGNQQTKENASPSFDEVLTSRRSIRAYEAGKTISEIVGKPTANEILCGHQRGEGEGRTGHGWRQQGAHQGRSSADCIDV